MPRGYAIARGVVTNAHMPEEAAARDLRAGAEYIDIVMVEGA